MQADPLTRLMSRREISSTGCWQWTGATTSAGYGHLWIDGRMQLAHRVAHELLVGPIPDDLTIDHLCRNRLCVNPSHLEPVTMRTNVLRGNGAAAINARRRFCVRGHDLDADDYRRPNGARRCRVCQRERKRV